MPDAAPPPTESHHLATFRSRGVAVPFTSPLLAGTRVREADRTGIELVVPSPSGGRGVYILNWAGVRALCNPTLHDTMLFRQFASLTAIDPPNVRDAALQVALNGAAGREAAAAAQTAIARDASQRVEAQFLLSMAVMEQLDPSSPKVRSLAERTADLDRRASLALHRIAPSLGRTGAQLALALIAVGDLFAPLGVAQDDREARTPRVLVRLREAHDDLSRWLSADAGNDISGVGQAVMIAMRRACKSGQATLEKIRAVPADPIALLKRWIIDGDGVVTAVARCGWLLDGWERVGLLWLSARTTASRRAALLEMAPMVPVLPREALEWTDLPIHAKALEEPCRVTSREDTWRTGAAAFALVERNEKLLAMSA
ncbi:MAG: hypothetical protein QOF70_6113 [Acetobacteraceae bacterium]|nr:hypothetical protein [Acetobacteraceae bacterium]